MKYRVRDKQFDYRYYGGDEGCIFNSLEGIRKDLVSYHSYDCDNNSLKQMTLTELLDFGEWELETISNSKAQEIIKNEKII